METQDKQINLDNKRLIGIKQIADEMGRHENTVRTMIKKGKIKPHKVGGVWEITRNELWTNFGF